MGIGDDLMATGEARRLQERDARCVRILTDGKPKWRPIWDGNPRLARREDVGDFQDLHARTGGLRSYIEAKSSQRWTWREYRPPPGEIYFTDAEREYGLRHGGRVILEPHTKAGASPNKNWGWMRWGKLAWILQEKYSLRVTQLGPHGTRLLEGVDHVVTEDFRMAAAVLATARGAALPEGGMHHAAAALGTPAVVIFGGFIGPSVTGYDSQVNLFTGEGVGCGARLPCDHCKAAMAAIKPEIVAQRLMEIIGNADSLSRPISPMESGRRDAVLLGAA